MNWGCPGGGVLVCRKWVEGRESRLPEVKQLTPSQIKGVS